MYKEKWSTLQKRLDIDMNKEISIFLNMGEFTLHIYKRYPECSKKSRSESVKRQRERRKAFGVCSRFGCEYKATKGFSTCKCHRIIDTQRHKVYKKIIKEM